MNECAYIYVCVLVLGFEPSVINILDQHCITELPAKN
ncbi:rCG34419 [Rattus norvegicus]|uniref:RCG34419 n=1 Tax=Rattus norvegicus TaxID=10116 RepID=A6HHS7_RAT|nr:rCG34419 [Rattus norvegicus]